MNASAPSAAQKYPATFYVSSRLLPSHVNRTVRVVGRVAQISADGGKVQLESCDGGMITIQRNVSDSELKGGLLTLSISLFC